MIDKQRLAKEYGGMQKKELSRRDFLKAVGVAGIASGIFPLEAAAVKDGENQQQTVIQMRPFGKTGRFVSMLSLGGMFDTPSNQLLLRQALRWGVTYWDTADCYGGGRSEEGIGKYFSRYPEDRKKVFLVTKSDARDPEGMTRLLNGSLNRLKTTTIDLYFIHGIHSISEMDEQMRAWVEHRKSEGKIRLFGFSTHSNMESCMLGAARLGWIDGIMMTYNYRLMHTQEMKQAVDACQNAGIGLTAMKTQGGGQVRTNTETELQLAGRFLQKGFTDGQAKLKAVWENPSIASICSQMPNLTLLMTNVAAAMNRITISSGDMHLLEQYARETESAYCSGCVHICEPAIGGRIPIGEIMRCLMYSRSYGDRERAVTLYHKLGPHLQERIEKEDFSIVENHCPRRMPIGRLMKEALHEFA